jgi:hypothetical protein
VTPGVELETAGRSVDEGCDDTPGLVSRGVEEVACDVRDDDTLLEEDEFKSDLGGASFGGDRSQFDLPLEDTFGGS